MTGEINFLNPGDSGLLSSNPEEPQRFRLVLSGVSNGIKMLVELNASVLVLTLSFQKLTLQCFAKSIWYIEYRILRFDNCVKEFFNKTDAV